MLTDLSNTPHASSSTMPVVTETSTLVKRPGVYCCGRLELAIAGLRALSNTGVSVRVDQTTRAMKAYTTLVVTRIAKDAA